MKKIICIILALCMSLSLCACGGNGGNGTPATTPAQGEASQVPDAGTPDGGSEDEAETKIKTVKEGVLTVATSPDFAPYEFYTIDESGNYQLAGFDVALAGYIADYLGLELEIIPMDFDGVLFEVASGNVDIGLAGLSPDPEREGAMDFSDLYYIGGQSFVTVKGSEDKFPTLEDANNSSYSIGAQTGSIQYDLALKHAPDAYIVMLSKVTDIIMELVSGKMDGAFIETAVAECYAVSYPDLVVLHEVPYDTKGSAVGVTKDNSALLAGVNEAIAAALSDGSMDQYIAEAYELATGNVYEGLLGDTAE